MAKIAKKSDAMDAIEKLTASILEIASPKQSIKTQKVLRSAYLDFSATMSEAALPTRVSEAERAELKKTFLSVAADFEAKAKALSGLAAERSIASASPAVESLAPMPAFSDMDELALESGRSTPDLLAKLSYDKFQHGDFAEARYFSLEWQKSLSSQKASDALFGESNLEKFRHALSTKLIERDPVSEEF
jgi:hypothetical protein